MQPLAPVNSHNLAPPSEADLVSSLSRLVGADECRRLWGDACRQAGVRPGGLNLDEIEAALQQLKQIKGMASISANSLLVRVKSYRTLSLLKK